MMPAMLLHTQRQPFDFRVSHLNKKLASRQRSLAEVTLDRAGQRKLNRRLKKQQKHEKCAYVLDFKGDISASAVAHLREEITLILSTARPDTDQVVVRLESPGGMVNSYGLAAAQLARLRDAGFDLTVCVDKVAASGGYMMACIAQHIVAAPFAVVGSIGVVAQLPNFYHLLKRLNIDFDVFTAGRYKRTVTLFGENTEDDKTKFEAELQQTHDLFKHFVSHYRPKLDIEAVATGEHWYGEDAIRLNLVDRLQTSDSYLLELMQERDVYLLESRKRPSLAERLGLSAAARVEQAASWLLSQQQTIQARDPRL